MKSTHTIQRAAIIGCGSIGQRHARNLQALGVKEIVALRSRQGQSQELDPVLGIREVADWEELISTRPDVAIISNPTSLHLETATHLLDHVRGLFIEKPLSSCLDGLPEFLEEVWQNRIVTFVGYNLQFHPVVSTIENLLAGERLGSPILYQGQVGHWLPDWHPYEDYRQAYTARSDLGGGVSLTLIHEVHLAQSLLGPARQVACFLPRSEILSLPVDVIADLMIESTSGAISQIHLDFIQRPLHREGVISCERGWIRYDLSKPQVTVLYEDSPAPEVAWESQDYDANQPYIEEIRTFIRFTSEGRVRHRSDAWSATRSLATVMAAFESTRSGCIACVPDWVMKL